MITLYDLIDNRAEQVFLRRKVGVQRGLGAAATFEDCVDRGLLVAVAEEQLGRNL